MRLLVYCMTVHMVPNTPFVGQLRSCNLIYQRIKNEMYGTCIWELQVAHWPSFHFFVKAVKIQTSLSYFLDFKANILTSSFCSIYHDRLIHEIAFKIDSDLVLKGVTLTDINCPQIPSNRVHNKRCVCQVGFTFWNYRSFMISLE